MLDLRHISLRLPSEGEDKEIIKNVSLTIPDNKVIVVTGPNGGGKSTLARLIAGVERPTEGSIVFNGEDITALGITERARKGIAFAFQQPVRFKGIRVLDLIRIAAGRPLSLPEACEYLSAVGLCALHYIDRELNSSLSGGELKRIEIATVLARGAELSVFDEPEAGIDLWSFQNLIELFASIIKSKVKNSILIISHQERILNIADEIVVLKEGRVELQGSRAEIYPKLVGSSVLMPECRKSGPMEGGEGIC